MKRTKRGRFSRVSLVAAAGVLATLASCGRQGPPPFKITEASLAACGNEVLAAVQQSMGTTFDDPVSFVTGTPGDVEGLLQAELRPQMRAQFDDASSAAVQADFLSSILSQAILAKYDFRSKRIVVVPENFRRLAEFIDEPALRTREALLAVLVHESVHAADDRAFRFTEKLSTLSDAETLQAYNAVLEGHAQCVARKVCADRGWAAGFEVFNRSIGKTAGLEKMGEGARYLAGVITATISLAYYDGERFMRAIEEEGGPAAVARAFSDPPKRLDVIFHPAWFLDPSKRAALIHDLDRGLNVVADSLDEGVWRVVRQDLGPSQLKAALALMPTETVDRALKNLKRARVVVAVRKEDPSAAMIVAGLYELTSAPEARAFAKVNERLARIKDEKMREGSIRVLDAAYEDIQGEGWQGVYYRKTVTAMGQDVIVRGALGTQGCVGAELCYSGEATTREVLEDLIAKMFAAAIRPGDSD